MHKRVFIIVGILLAIESAMLEAKKASDRVAQYPVDPIFLKRQTRYDLHRTLSERDLREKLNRLFSAFIWAPSSYNGQPGRLIYALHGGKEWKTLYKLLDSGNQEWAKNAGALIVVLSRKNFEYNEEPSKTHSFDTGLAVENLLLQASVLGLVANAVEGFDYKKARKLLKVPYAYDIEIMIVIGEQASPECSTKKFAQLDAKPKTRKKIEDFAFEGTFGE